MKIILLILFVTVRLVFPQEPGFLQEPNLPPLPEGTAGAYYWGSRTYVCTNYRICIHEIAHLTDYWNDCPSLTEEFAEAVDQYRLDNKSGLVGWGEYLEVYADLLADVAADFELMPEEFRKFYDWDKIERELETWEDHIVKETK